MEFYFIVLPAPLHGIFFMFMGEFTFLWLRRRLKFLILCRICSKKKRKETRPYWNNTCCRIKSVAIYGPRRGSESKWNFVFIRRCMSWNFLELFNFWCACDSSISISSFNPPLSPSACQWSGGGNELYRNLLKCVKYTHRSPLTVMCNTWPLSFTGISTSH
jgi:hypothetical protein